MKTFDAIMQELKDCFGLSEDDLKVWRRAYDDAPEVTRAVAETKLSMAKGNLTLACLRARGKEFVTLPKVDGGVPLPPGGLTARCMHARGAKLAPVAQVRTGGTLTERCMRAKGLKV